MDQLIRQHTFAMLVMCNHALHLAHEAYHRTHIENAIAPTPDGDALILAAHERLRLAMRVQAEAQEAEVAQSGLYAWFMRLP